MWNTSVRVLLLFVPVVFANASNNDCHPKSYGNIAIHACQNSSFSGPAVAMDASMFSGSYCECTLTTSRKASRDCVVFVDVIYAIDNHIIQFSVDNITYTNTSRDKKHNFNGDSIRVVVERTHTRNRILRIGNPCITFKLRENANNSLTLSCYKGTDIDPRQSEHETSTTNSEIEKITTQLQQSPRPTTSVIQDFTTQSNKLQENVPTKFGDFTTQSNGPKKSGGTYTVIIIIVVTGVCTAIIIVLITCYCKRQNRSPIISDENMIKPRKKDVYEVTEMAMYVPMELLNQPSCTQGSTEPVYDQPDIDSIANHAHENETKTLLQGQVTSVNENEVTGTVEQSDGDDTDVTVFANSEKNNQENQDHIPNEQKEELYA